MTDRELKQTIISLCDGIYSREISPDLIPSWDKAELDEAVNELRAVVLRLPPERLWSVLETEDEGTSREELAQMNSELETADEEEYDEKAAAMLEAILENANLNGTIDLYPSSHWED